MAADAADATAARQASNVSLRSHRGKQLLIPRPTIQSSACERRLAARNRPTAEPLARCNARISVRSRQIQVAQCASTKKALFPWGNRARQDGTVVHARGCLPTYCHQNLQCCCYVTAASIANSCCCVKRYFNVLPVPLLLLLLLLLLTFYCKSCCCMNRHFSFLPLQLPLPLQMLLPELLLHYSPVPRLQLHLAATPC